MVEKRKTPLEELKKAKEESYFEKKNREALEKMAGVSAPLNSPASGAAMKQETIEGIEIYRCEQSGGVWIDGRHIPRLARDSGLAARLFQVLTKTPS